MSLKSLYQDGLLMEKHLNYTPLDTFHLQDLLHFVLLLLITLLNSYLLLKPFRWWFLIRATINIHGVDFRDVDFKMKVDTFCHKNKHCGIAHIYIYNYRPLLPQLKYIWAFLTIGCPSSIIGCSFPDFFSVIFFHITLITIVTSNQSTICTVVTFVRITLLIYTLKTIRFSLHIRNLFCQSFNDRQ